MELGLAESTYGVDFSDVEVSFKLRGKCAGKAKALVNRIGGEIFKATDLRLEFNATAIDLHYEEMVKNTIPHEVAHLVCYVNPKLGSGHDIGFKRVCKGLGGCGSTTHSMELPSAKTTRKYRYRASCGTAVELTSRRHNNLQSGKSQCYMLEMTKGRIRKDDWENYGITVETPIETPSAKESAGVATRNGTRTKADIVRELLRNYTGTLDNAVNDKAFIQLVMQESGHELHMAKRYVKDFTAKMRA